MRSSELVFFKQHFVPSHGLLLLDEAIKSTRRLGCARPPDRRIKSRAYHLHVWSFGGADRSKTTAILLHVLVGAGPSKYPVVATYVSSFWTK